MTLCTSTGLYQEWIELDLFNYGLKRFSAAEWDEAGVTEELRGLLSFMADQETGHAQLLTNVSRKLSFFKDLR